jgi:hypothetical protein
MATPGQAGRSRKEEDTDGRVEDTGAVEAAVVPWYSMSLVTIRTLRDAVTKSYPSFDARECEQIVELITEEGEGALKPEV